MLCMLCLLCSAVLLGCVTWGSRYVCACCLSRKLGSLSWSFLCFSSIRGPDSRLLRMFILILGCYSFPQLSSTPSLKSIFKYTSGVFQALGGLLRSCAMPRNHPIPPAQRGVQMPGFLERHVADTCTTTYHSPEILTHPMASL